MGIKIQRLLNRKVKGKTYMKSAVVIPEAFAKQLYKGKINTVKSGTFSKKKIVLRLK